MWGVLMMKIAFIILMLTTGSLVWLVAFLISLPAFYIARFYPWGGKDMNTICRETVDRWIEEDEKNS